MFSVEFDQSAAEFQCWKVKTGAFVSAGAVLFVYKDPDGNLLHFKTKNDGIVDTMENIEPGEMIQEGRKILKLKDCEHPIVMKDMCADCGIDLRPKDGLPGERTHGTEARVAMIHSIPELHISPEEAKVAGAADAAKLLEQRRLVLLVDLDQTLIHTTNERIPNDIKDVHHYQLYGNKYPWYHTRIRPHTAHFLESMSKLYELHICTFGQRLYAHTIANIVDPNGTLFGQRILSRDECFDASAKTANLKALFPTGDHLVCIIDDRADVWHWANNCVQVKPYRFFKHTGDINAPPGLQKTDANTSHEFQFDHKEGGSDAKVEEGHFPDVGEEQKDTKIEDDDDYLYHLEDILTRLHDAFYQLYDKTNSSNNGDVPDMKSVVPYVRGKVLSSVRLVFSGVIPTSADLFSSQIYQTAKAFGATVHEQIITKEMALDDNDLQPTTHLVAAKWGTSKVNQAVKLSDIVIVQPQWLWACIERWEKVEESLFSLAKDGSDSFSAPHYSLSQPPAPVGQARTRRDSEPHFLDLNMFSSGQLARMSAEVEDALSGEDEEKSGAEDTNSDDDSLSGDTPRGWKRKCEDLKLDQQLEAKKSKSEESSSSSSDSEINADESGEDEDIAEALEKELTR